jgi:hypothetical protein
MVMVQDHPIDRVLRFITILCWIPAFALLLPYGIVSEQLFPALGLVPMTTSGALAVLHLCHWITSAKSPTWSLILEFWCGAFQIGFLIPSWVMMAEGVGYYWYNGNGLGLAMLGSYGTTPMMVCL